MFRLSNLVTALFGVIAALGTILGIGSLGNASKIAEQPSDQLTQDLDPTIAATPSNGVAGLNAQDSIAQSGSRQVGQNATNSSDAAVTEDSAAKTTVQNPTAEFVVQGEGAVLTAEPAPPSTPSEATAVQLDPSPGVAVAPSAPATVPSQAAPVAQAPVAAERTPAPAPTPVRAMW